MDAKTAASRLNLLFSDASNEDYAFTEVFAEAVQEGIKALEKVQNFEEIGTIEEFKALKEKVEPKKPIRNDLCTCPRCITHNEVIQKRRNTVAFDTVYCWHCGQAISVVP